MAKTQISVREAQDMLDRADAPAVIAALERDARNITRFGKAGVWSVFFVPSNHAADDGAARKQIVDALLDRGVDLNATGLNGRSMFAGLLARAQRWTTDEKVRILVDNWPAMDQGNRQSALAAALWGGQDSLREPLLRLATPAEVAGAFVADLGRLDSPGLDPATILAYVSADSFAVIVTADIVNYGNRTGASLLHQFAALPRRWARAAVDRGAVVEVKSTQDQVFYVPRSAPPGGGESVPVTLPAGSTPLDVAERVLLRLTALDKRYRTHERDRPLDQERRAAAIADLEDNVAALRSAGGRRETADVDPRDSVSYDHAHVLALVRAAMAAVGVEESVRAALDKIEVDTSLLAYTRALGGGVQALLDKLGRYDWRRGFFEPPDEFFDPDELRGGASRLYFRCEELWTSESIGTVWVLDGEKVKQIDSESGTFSLGSVHQVLKALVEELGGKAPPRPRAKKSPRKPKAAAVKGPLQGVRVVLTGDFDRPRDEIKAALEAQGAKVTASVSGKTDLLVMGTKAGGMKVGTAEHLGVRIESADALPRLLRGQGLAGLDDPTPVAPGPAPAPPPVPAKGDRVRVVAGPERGAEGVVFWWGASKYGPGERAGIRADDGSTIWVDAADLARV